jgi:hypothetical protein
MILYNFFILIIFSAFVSSTDDPIAHAIVDTVFELFVKNEIPLDIIISKDNYETSSIINQIG